MHPWIYFVDTSCCDLCSGHVQRIWSDVVQQLQRRLRVSCWIDVVDAGCCDMRSRSLQWRWSDVVQ
jgi:hypothetical protein